MATVAVSGQLWNYIKIEGKGVPMIVMHGWGRSSNEWNEIGQELHKMNGKPVYILDLPGFGGSSLPMVESIEEYSELVASLCNYLEINKAILIGHSLGGRIAIVLSSKYPKMVDRLILIDPAGLKARSVKRLILQVVAKLFGWLPVKVKHRLASPVMDEDYRNSPPLRELYRAVVRQDLRDNLAKIKQRTDLIWGEHDEILPVSMTHEYRKLLTNCRVRIVWGAGHDPHITHFRELKRILEEIEL